jgi:ribosomal-protein-alanine N-acetyltransferase
MKIKKITTERLYLIPFTIPIAQEVLNQQYTILSDMGLNLSQGWPDEDMMETQNCNQSGNGGGTFRV